MLPARSRREFLASAAAAGSFLLGCGDDDTAAGGGGQGGVAGCDAFAGGELLGTLPFIDDGDQPLEMQLNVGWDGRLYTDLSALTPETLITPNESFYIRTRYPDQLDPEAPWSLAVSGQIATPIQLMLEDLLPLAGPRGVHLMECSGNGNGGSFGLLSAASWGGIAMPDVLALAGTPRPTATRVLVSGFDGHSVPSVNGHSKPGASWVFTRDQLANAFLATEMNGAPLPRDHGSPLRLLVPGWYGCTCIKWVDRIVLVDDSEPATAQMQEFAARTHQDGVPALAADYRPATIDQAAMPVRVETWRVGGEIVQRVVGIMWGGYEPTSSLSIRFGDGAWTKVDVCPAASTNATWTLWSHAWRPAAAGTYEVRMRVDDPAIVTRRLDQDYYLRTVAVTEG